MKVGDVVKPSGVGYTADWDPDLRGVITRITQDAVFVQWPGVEDELEPELVTVVDEQIEPPPPYIILRVKLPEDEEK